ncbi:MAG: hypothetical protein AAB515_02450 [Patescibacteria group bacterium]
MEDTKANPNVYRQTLREAWRLTWQHKFLWFFGFFAFLLNIGILSGAVSFIQNIGTVSTQAETAANARIIYENQTLNFIWNNIKTFGAELSFQNVLTLVIIAGIFAFFIWMSVVAQGALIAATGSFRAGKSTTPEDSFRQGTKNFWPVLWLNLLRYAATTGLAVLVTIPLLTLFLTQENGTWLTLLTLLNFLILIPLATVVGFLLQFALASAVLKKRKLGAAIMDAVRLFRSHWLATIEMSLLLLLIVGIAAYLFSLVFSDNLVEVYLAQSAGYTVGFKQYFTVTFALFVIANVVFNGIVVAFNFVVTTLFYHKLQEGVFTSKLVRMFGHWGKVGESKKPALKMTK